MASAFIDDMADSPSDPRQGSLQECIARLSIDEMASLRNFAKLWMIRIKGRVSDKDAADLLQEAVLRTLDGRRIWYRQTNSLAEHLKWAAKSIAYEWGAKEAARPRGGLLLPIIAGITGAALAGPPGAIVFATAARMASSRDEQEEGCDQIIQKVRLRLKADVIACHIFEMLMNDETPEQIRGTLDMDAKVFNAARKRISRRLIEVVQERSA